MKSDSRLNYSLKLIVKTSMIVLIGIIISKIALYAYRVIIARHFGPEVYGLFSIALMILNLFVAISTLGLNEGLLRYISISRGENNNKKIVYLFKNLKKISFISSILVAVLLFLFSDIISNSVFHNSALSIYLKISAIIIPFYVLSSFYLAAIRAFEMVGWYSFIINILQNVVKLAALALMIFFGFKSQNIMYSFFIGIFIMFLAAYWLCKYKIDWLFQELSKKKFKSGLLKEVMYYSLPLMFSSVFGIIYYWIDSFALGYLKNATAVGFYNAIIPIALLISIVPDLFIQMFYPLITKEYSKKNFKIIKELSKQVSKWSFILALPLFLIILIFPGAVINILFGPNYLIAENALRVLSIGSFISLLSGLLFTLLSMAGKSKTIFLTLIISSAINLTLNLFLIPRYGINGAAIATTIVWIGLTVFLFSKVYSILSFVPLRRKMIRILLVSLIPTGLLIYVKSFFTINLLTLALLGIFFIFLYLLIMFLTNCLDRNDIMIIKSFKHKLLGIKTAPIEDKSL